MGKPIIVELAKEFFSIARVKNKFNRIIGDIEKNYPDEKIVEFDWSELGSIKKEKKMPKKIILVEYEENITPSEAAWEASKFGLKQPSQTDALRFFLQHHEHQELYPIIFPHKSKSGKCIILGDSDTIDGYCGEINWISFDWKRYDGSPFPCKIAFVFPY